MEGERESKRRLGMVGGRAEGRPRKGKDTWKGRGKVKSREGYVGGKRDGKGMGRLCGKEEEW